MLAMAVGLALGWHPAVASALSISSDLGSAAVVNVGQPVQVAVELVNEDKRAINGLEATIAIPKRYFAFEDYWLGESLVTLWVQDPVVRETDSAYIVSLAGLIPGGTSQSGTLITLVLKPTQAARQASLGVYDPKIYLHSPTADVLEAPNQFLFVEIAPYDAGRAPQQEVVVADSVPPEEFFPVVGKSRALFGDDYFVMFQAIDRQTGIDRYEILETVTYFENPETEQVYFRPAENPMRLQDQTLGSYIYIRAFDRAGNSRTVIIPPTVFVEKSGWGRILWIGSAVVLFGLLFAWMHHARKARRRPAHHDQ
jgi:hypothetical protein